jgi:hypothetical protein
MLEVGEPHAAQMTKEVTDQTTDRVFVDCCLDRHPRLATR